MQANATAPDLNRRKTPPIVPLSFGVLMGAAFVVPAPFSLPPAWGWWLVGLPLLLVGFVPWRWQTTRTLLLLSAGVTLGGWLAQAPLRQPQIVDSDASVAGVLWTGYSQGVLVRPAGAHPPTAPLPDGRLLATIPPLPAVAPGDRIRVRGVLEPDRYRGELRWRLDCVEHVILQPREQGPRSAAWRAIADLPGHRELAAALLLGNGRPPERDTFREAGLMHLLAVSGMHVGLALAGIWAGLYLLRVPYPWRDLLIAMAGGGYLWLTGAALPTQRAVAMLWAFVLARLLARVPHPLAAVCLAGLVLIVLHPQDAARPGFQFSFVAVLGILTLGRDGIRLLRRSRLLEPWPLDRPSWRTLLIACRWSLEGLIVGGSATVAIAPLLAWHLQQATPWSPLATVLATPALVGSILGGLIATSVQFLQIDLLSDIANGTWYSCLQALTGIVGWCALWPGSHLSAPPPPAFVLIAWPLLFLPMQRRLHLLRVALLALLLLVLWAWW